MRETLSINNISAMLYIKLWFGSKDVAVVIDKLLFVHFSNNSLVRHLIDLVTN